MTQPEIEQQRGPTPEPCDLCGEPSTSLRTSPLEREDQVCRYCHLVLVAVGRHTKPAEEIASGVAAFVAETEQRKQGRQSASQGGGQGNR